MQQEYPLVTIRLVKLVLLLSLIVGSPASGSDAYRPVVGGYAAKRIELASPAEVKPRPEGRRNVLVFAEPAEAHLLRTGKQATLMQHVPHESAASAVIALEAMSRSSKAFGLRVETDPNVFDPAKLKNYDAIVLANVYLEGKLFAAPPENETGKGVRELTDAEKAAYAARQKALIDFVASGKGLVAIHAAACPTIDWPAYHDMLGGKHTGHAWYRPGSVPVRNDTPQHPINAAFGGKGFTIEDDVYIHGGPYARDRVKVLLSVDVSRARASKYADRADSDYPLSWIKRHGDGRVFYTALGDNPVTYENPRFLRHLLDGVRYALGDLHADDAPGAPRVGQKEMSKMAGWTNLLPGNLEQWQGLTSSWKLKDGVLYFSGGNGQATTKKQYTNYMLRVDWRLPRPSDTGILLRDRSQQVNVWTHPMGSGELWAAKPVGEKHTLFGTIREPLVNADRPVGEWNTFIITVRGDQVTVELNGQTVIEPIALQLKPTGSISFQNHTDPVEFQKAYVKELD